MKGQIVKINSDLHFVNDNGKVYPCKCRGIFRKEHITPVVGDYVLFNAEKKLIEEIRDRNWTQKQFAVLVWKKNSEVNELIKWKRNITIQWDLILSEVFWTPEKYWINMQTDYDYEIAKKEREKQKMEQKQEFEVVTDIEKPEIVEEKSSNETESWKVENNKESQNIVAPLPDKQEKSENSFAEMKAKLKGNEEQIEYCRRTNKWPGR